MWLWGVTTCGGCGDRMNEDVDKDKLLSEIEKDKLSDEGGDNEKLLSALSDEGKDLQDKDLKEMGVDLTVDMLKGMDGISQHRDGDYILDGFIRCTTKSRICKWVQSQR